MVFVNPLVLMIVLSISHFAVSDDSIKADLELIKKNMALISNKPFLSGAERQRLDHMSTLMLNVTKRLEGKEESHYLVMNKEAQQLSNDIDMLRVTWAAPDTLIDPEAKAFLYDEVPCDLNYSLAEWRAETLSSRRLNTVRCYMEAARDNIYKEYLAYLEKQPDLKGSVNFRFYIKPNGRLMVFKKDSDLPSDLVTTVVKKLMLIQYPPMSETDFEVQYTFAFYPN
ncbi:hypothetical protein QNI23_001355 [Bermanella sp. WJH001]|uniref:hypothetical protein n=1 Tax=Bermanella sp. WJH001 TaxID=3048005 RepID=UPI0024BD9617|nr:hypothetical protein [Bermanella sp. WJH001]MDJ1538597.1 hypothetical protein [Bermanella sp. WJH001]